MVTQNGRERPDQAGADRLSAEPAEPEGERHRAPHVRFELHRLEGHLQARQTRRRVAPESEPRFVALDQDRLQTGLSTQRAQLASRYSEDPTSKVDGGSLGLSTRGQYVAEFDDAAWQLAPGGISEVVKSQFGYHIIRRPPLAEVRDSFRIGLQERMSRHADSMYADSLVIRRKIQPVSNASAYAKAAAQDMEAARSSNRVLVKYRGGSLKVRDFARWLNALDPQILSALPQANDEQINQFLKSLAQQQLMLELADSAKVALTAADWQRVRAEHDSTMLMITNILNLSPEMLRDSAGKTADERVSFALGRVNDYFDRVFHGRARFYPLPAFLADTLLADARWDVDAAGVRRAVERGQEIRSDSAQASNAPRIAPAPGPAPIDTTRRQAPR